MFVTCVGHEFIMLVPDAVPVPQLTWKCINCDLEVHTQAAANELEGKK